MSCQDATISGSISIDDGIVGWTVDDEDSGGFLQNSDISASIILNPTTPEMLFLTSSTSNVLETKIKIKPQNGSSDINVTNISVTGMDVTTVTPTHLTVSDNTFTYGIYQTETLTSNFNNYFTGTFQLDIKQPYNFHWNGVPQQTYQVWFATVYPNYSPT